MKGKHCWPINLISGPLPTFRAGDITELKILEIPGLGDNGQCGDFQHPDLGIPALDCPGGASQNGTGKLLKKPSSAPQNIPRRTDVKTQEVVLSPQLHPCSKSYMDRHVEALNPSKNFRRRHNSCESLLGFLLGGLDGPTLAWLWLRSVALPAFSMTPPNFGTPGTGCWGLSVASPSSSRIKRRRRRGSWVSIRAT